jgi:hypothetical protein
MGGTPLVRVVVILADGTRVALPLFGDGAPDLTVVDALARFQLALRRAGARVSLQDLSPALRELLDLVGLDREMTGQSESGEEFLGVEEGVDPGH